MTGFEFTLTLDFQFIQCLKAPSEYEYNEMKHAFRKPLKNSFMNPAVRNGFKDGNESFFNDNYLPIGLWGELQEYIVNKGYDFICHGLETFLNFSLDKETIFEFINNIFENTEVSPRWYQYESIYRILKYRYSSQQLSTASGKTIISYSVFAYLKYINQVNKDKKFLLIVPRSGLVDQTYKKFINEYNNGFIGDFSILPIGGSHKFDNDKFRKSECIISTYQSLNRLKDEAFNLIRSINIDEGHTARTNSISRCIDLSSPLRYRFGLSGTLLEDIQYAEYYQNLKNSGPLTMIYDPKDLINDGFAPNVEITKVSLNYDNLLNDDRISKYLEFRENKPKNGIELQLQYFKDLYKIERDMILSDELRLQAIINFIKDFDKNTLILFNDIKGSHGKNIFDKLSLLDIDCEYIDGNTKDSDRFVYTDAIEEKRMNLVASYGTFSTGIDLKNIHYIVLAESFKSGTLIGQSIGRGLRSLIDKKVIHVIDIVDLLYKHTVNQYNERCKIYKKQNYPIKKVDIVLT